MKIINDGALLHINGKFLVTAGMSDYDLKHLLKTKVEPQLR